MSSEISDAELHAWVDGRLPPHDDARVRRALEDDPAAAEAARAYRAIDAELRAAFDSIADSPAPARLVRAAYETRARWPVRIAAALAWSAIGVAAGWHLHARLATGGDSSAALAGPALSAHTVYEPENRHSVEVQASEEQHLVRWLSKRLGRTVLAPHLGEHGFRLVGGRLLPVDGKPAAQFLYEDANGARVMLFLSARGGESVAFRYHESDGLGAFYWVDREMGYALTGRLGREALLDLAQLVFDQFEP